jgi:hypothetical protein
MSELTGTTHVSKDGAKEHNGPNWGDALTGASKIIPARTGIAVGPTVLCVPVDYNGAVWNATRALCRHSCTGETVQKLRRHYYSCCGPCRHRHRNASCCLDCLWQRTIHVHKLCYMC